MVVGSQSGQRLAAHQGYVCHGAQADCVRCSRWLARPYPTAGPLHDSSRVSLGLLVTRCSNDHTGEFM